jgi:hypothetical protein
MDLFESKSDLKDYSFWVGISGTGKHL